MITEQDGIDSRISESLCLDLKSTLRLLLASKEGRLFEAILNVFPFISKDYCKDAHVSVGKGPAQIYFLLMCRRLRLMQLSDGNSKHLDCILPCSNCISRLEDDYDDLKPSRNFCCHVPQWSTSLQPILRKQIIFVKYCCIYCHIFSLL